MSDEEKDVPPHRQVIKAFFIGFAVAAGCAILGISVGTTIYLKFYF